MSNEAYDAFIAQSLNEREAFWLKQADLIDWSKKPARALEYSRPPFAHWFPDGETNLCVNAVDRWAKRTPHAKALIYVSTETGAEHTYTFAELLAQTCNWAALLRHLNVNAGDRVLIYLPMIPEAVFAMLACARIGAVHAVVFGGFASGALSARIDDASPKVVISADAGMRGGKIIPYKPLLDEALVISRHEPKHVVLVDRGLAAMSRSTTDLDAQTLLNACKGDDVPAVPLASSHPSYILYTSGTTGAPKGVQRDTGGYAVALAASMKYIFAGTQGGAFFAASDIGWVVGHSYIVYGPLIAGMATLLYEGVPNRPDSGILWRLAEKHKISSMFVSPTALRLLKKESDHHIRNADLSALNALFVAGEPLDEPTSTWIGDALGAPIIDNYWQTETGWPILSICKGLGDRPTKPGSPGLAVFGYDVHLLHEETGEPVRAGEKGVVAIAPPLPPGCMSTIWNDDARFLQTYFTSFPDQEIYSTFDWGVRDEDGYVFILGRTDDVINVAGHRLGTREIEEVIARHSAVAEAAVVGVHDTLKTQAPVAFVVLKSNIKANAELARTLIAAVAHDIGAIAKPKSVYWVPSLPKTRSGKILRRAIQAICEDRDTGDLSTIDDPDALEHVRAALNAPLDC